MRSQTAILYRCTNMQSHAQDELLKIYRREYKRRFAWIRAGKISQETFSAFLSNFIPREGYTHRPDTVQ